VRYNSWMFLEAVTWGMLGLIVGSFTNVLILRHGHASLMGRSACPRCKRELEWYELVPVLSWLVLRGRCRTCHARISLQYPAVELLMGGLFVAIGLAPVSSVVRIVGCAIAILLVAIAVYDLRHTIMPDSWVYGFAGLSLFGSTFAIALEGEASVSSVSLLLVAGPLTAFPLWFLWRISGGRWMGFGDVKFALGMGWLLGAWQGFVALTLAFVIGAIVGVGVLLPLPYFFQALRSIGITGFHATTRGFTMKSEVPFGPFLIFSTCIVWISLLHGVDIASYLTGLFFLY